MIQCERFELGRPGAIGFALSFQAGVKGIMLGGRKKPEGFEWHKYVRTTIKLRREARRDKAGQLKRSAAEGIKAAGEAAGDMAKQGARQFAAGARVAGSAAGAAARESARQLGASARTAAACLASGTYAAALAFARGVGVGVAWTGDRLARIARSEALSPAMDLLSRPGVASPLALAGIVGVAAAFSRPALGFGFDRDAGIALLLGLACLSLAYGPRALRGTAPELPRWLSNLSPSARRGAAIAGLALTLAAIGASLLPGRGSLPTVGHLASFQFLRGPQIVGRATALSGDILRIDGTTVKLAGIEAPEREQRCLRHGNRRWRCAEAAHDALARLSRSRLVKCDPKGTDASGRTTAVCFAGETDIGAALVKAGHVFAEGGFLARYSSLESEAKAAKVGLWSGDAERPQDFRARAWEQAKRTAPEGCPIKGQVAGGAKVYLLPWSPDYGRVRVSKARGDRWFCSEQEAISAGWRATERG
jgi:endonuclease YncB( thermonuclease family)